MTNFTEQVKHNETFHTALCTNFCDTYFDWKITSVFYSAYHLIKALADFRHQDIGNRHADIMRNINPKNHNRVLQMKNDAFEAYDQLFEYSWTARYDGFISFEDFQLVKRKDHEHAIHIYTYFRRYILSQGVKL